MNWDNVIDVHPTRTGLICKFCLMPIEECNCLARKIMEKELK